MTNDLRKLIDSFKTKKILVYGDVMLDLYIRGNVERISPEAPVPVIVEKTREYVLGGAGNVAANIASLGGKVTLVGVIGEDAEGKVVERLCRHAGIEPRLVVAKDRPTILKARAVAKRHQLLRMDRESTNKISSATSKKILTSLSRVRTPDRIIVSDYIKGSVVPSVVSSIGKKFGSQKIIAGIKPGGQILLKNIEAISLNLKEAHVLTGMGAETELVAKRAVKKLAELFRSSVVLTRGEYGITTLDKESGAVSHIPTRAVQVYDVSGAGDTVIAVFALMRACGATVTEAAGVANHAAGIVVGVEGTATVSPDILKSNLESYETEKG